MCMHAQAGQKRMPGAMLVSTINKKGVLTAFCVVFAEHNGSQR